MSSTSRRFGTDVSNIPSNVFHKVSSKRIVNKSQQTPKSNTTKSTARVTAIKTLPLFDVMDSFKFEIDDEITITSPVKLSVSYVDEFRYERDFLMKFQEFCKEPIDDLIPEVRPGYIHPEPTMEVPIKSQLNFPSSAAPTGVKFSNVIESSLESTQVASNEQSTTSREWKVKKVKKQKPREQDPRRLAARQKQIDIGMNTVGYQKFMELVPPSARTKSHPKVPDIHQVCSKRSWDGQVRKWRRQLHDFDPTPDAAGQTAAGFDETAAERSSDASDDESSEDEVF